MGIDVRPLSYYVYSKPTLERSGLIAIGSSGLISNIYALQLNNSLTGKTQDTRVNWRPQKSREIRDVINGRMI